MSCQPHWVTSGRSKPSSANARFKILLIYVTKCILPCPFNPFFFSSCGPFPFLIGQDFYGPNYPKCLNLRTGPAMSSFSQCPCRSRSSFSVSCWLGTIVSDSGESLHCFLVGVNKSYVIATSDLWLFIHVSNLLPSLSTPLPYIYVNLFSTQIRKSNPYTNIKQKIHTYIHVYTNIKTQIFEVSPFHAALVKKNYNARTCWYRWTFHLVYRY